MENNQTLNETQVVLSNREIQRIRLKKTHRTQTWLARQLGVIDSYVSIYFTQNAYPYLEEKIETIIYREEKKIQERKERKQQAQN